MRFIFLLFLQLGLAADIFYGSTAYPNITAESANQLSSVPFDADHPTQVTLSFGASNSPYKYILIPFAAPVMDVVNGSFQLSASDFASSEDGYTLSDANGFHYRQVIDEHGTFRAYRLFNRIHGAFQIKLVP